MFVATIAPVALSSDAEVPETAVLCAWGVDERNGKSNEKYTTFDHNLHVCYDCIHTIHTYNTYFYYDNIKCIFS